jgi:hypothetical protein
MKIKSLLIASLVASSALFTSGGVAEAKAGCYGAGCRGKGPMQMGCNKDAVTLASASDYNFRVELRYSRKCNARWARTTFWRQSYYPVRIYAQLGTGEITRNWGRAPVVWSYMWSGAIRACGGALKLPGVGSVRTHICTGAR